MTWRAPWPTGRRGVIGCRPLFLPRDDRLALCSRVLTPRAWARARSQAAAAKDPSDRAAASAAASLAPRAAAKREALQAEMMGKLKELGNSVLGFFGLSCDNFATTKDPATGSYSVQFVQDPAASRGP